MHSDKLISKSESMWDRELSIYNSSVLLPASNPSSVRNCIMTKYEENYQDKTYNEHTMNIQWTYNEHTMNINEHKVMVISQQ